jgi:hypothetical protein
MNESEIVLLLDESIWSHVEHMNKSVGLQLTEDKALDILGALYDIYHVNKKDKEQAQELLIGLAALLVAAPLGQADRVWEELMVHEGMRNFELSMEDLLNGKHGA